MLKHAAIVVAAILCAVPAWPCSLILPDADEWTYPFEDARVPQNAELRVLGAPFALSTTWASELPMTLDGPGGSIEASIVEDDLSAVVVPATPLVAGAWTLTIDSANPDAGPRVIRFELLDEVDETPPVIDAASAEVRTVGDFFADPDGCGGGRHDELAVTVRAANDDAVIAMLVDQQAVGIFSGVKADIVTGPDVGQVDVVAIDFAGNVSEPVSVEVVRGCSSSSMPLAIPLALGLLVRRRRR